MRNAQQMVWTKDTSKRTNNTQADAEKGIVMNNKTINPTTTKVIMIV